MVRAVEQQYWTLAQRSTRSGRSSGRPAQPEHVLEIEQADCHNNTIAIDEAVDRLKQFQKTLADRKADAEKAERQFRKLLGLPESDNRQIIPVDEPIKEHVVFDREKCHEQMMQMRPEIIQQAIIRLAEGKLNRAVLETDRAYQSYEKTNRLRTATAQRLEAQRAYWDEGRITSDRYLDAVEQHATLVAAEHQHLAAYNSALTAVGECKGTLLDDRNIIATKRRRYCARQRREMLWNVRVKSNQANPTTDH